MKYNYISSEITATYKTRLIKLNMFLHACSLYMVWAYTLYSQVFQIPTRQCRAQCTPAGISTATRAGSTGRMFHNKRSYYRRTSIRRNFTTNNRIAKTMESIRPYRSNIVITVHKKLREYYGNTLCIATLVKLVLFMGYAPTPVDTASSAQAISHAYTFITKSAYSFKWFSLSACSHEVTI